jgi:hypothetical protein
VIILTKNEQPPKQLKGQQQQQQQQQQQRRRRRRRQPHAKRKDCHTDLKIYTDTPRLKQFQGMKFAKKGKYVTLKTLFPTAPNFSSRE